MLRHADATSAASGRMTTGPTPITNDQGREVVGQASEPAADTHELGLCSSIGFVHEAAARTGTRGVPWIDVDHGHTCQCRFVGDELAQLVERPGVQGGSWGGPPSLDPGANAREVFESNPTLRALSLSHDALADRMVGTGAETVFRAPPPLQQALCRAGAFSVEAPPNPTLAMAQAVDVPAGVERGVRVGGNVLDAQIDTEVVLDLPGWRLDHVDGRQQIPVAVTQHEIALALTELQQVALAFATHERDGLATANRPDRHVLRAVAQDAVVIGDAAHRTEATLSTTVQFVGVRDFGDEADHDLRGQPETLPRLAVDELLELELAEGALAPGDAADVVGRRVGLLQRLPQQPALLIGRHELERHNQTHVSSIDDPPAWLAPIFPLPAEAGELPDRSFCDEPLRLLILTMSPWP